MNKLTIMVGTTSEPKIKYLKEVLKDLKVIAKLIPLEVKSGVSEQPKNSQETEQGSINRAKAAFENNKEADFAMGIEVGYHKESNAGYEMFCWVTIIDSNGYQISNQSHKFLLPKYHQEILHANKFINEHLEGYLKSSKHPAKKHIDEMIRHRKTFIENAIRYALLQYLAREDY